MNREITTATVLKTGPGSSVQDLGRWGHASFGVPVSGILDLRSFHWINHLLQNQKNDAVLEISQPGFTIQFDSPTSIALAGATASIKLNGQDTENSGLIPIKRKDILEIGGISAGARIYLGIRFGFKTEKILGSRSFYEGLTKISQLSKGSKIPYSIDSGATPIYNAKARWSVDWYQNETIFVYPGPDFSLLKENVKEKLLNETFRISQLSNRMGIQLLELLENELPELPTNPVYPGTIQLTSGGKLLILLKDAQVTGGYPRILQLDEESQWVIAQKKPGDLIQIKLKKL
ncbi:biotin-dependent carboxyltransferase family protein [Algoriphagus sp. A40]|uniref:5-oxoprolinase subunit C family protein n=1 Tax=Algoriphagus sp. A40 TaxID=1945863 RepID=UPI0009854A7A|nr:biotin-dependent carboxyltransferase family protein [Algoriphagus sp. A40]OOG73770.1 hypothetical protein B0E43_13070 [Algoriphagus sp. A40]